jgi:hypothetical protein
MPLNFLNIDYVVGTPGRPGPGQAQTSCEAGLDLLIGDPPPQSR